MDKLLLVDIDDTLCNSSAAYKKAHTACFNYLKKIIPNLSKKRFDTLYLKSKNNTHKKLNGTASSHNRFLYFQNLFEQLDIAIKPALLNKITNIYWRTVYKNLKIFPTVKETLKIIKHNGIKMGIVSDLLAQIQITKLEHLKIVQYFDFIVSSEEAGKEKPFSPIFKLAIKKSEYLKNFQTYMIGDNCKKDIVGAENMNFVSIYFGNGRCSIADHSIKTFKEIISILDISKEIDGYIKFHYTWTDSKTLDLKVIKHINKCRNYFYKRHFIGITKDGIGFGNISHRHEINKFVITGNATGGIQTLTSKHYSLVTDWDYKNNYLVCSGAKVASSESLSHAIIYDTLKNVNVVLHIHNHKLWRKLNHKIPTTSSNAKYGTPEMTREIKKIIKNNKLDTGAILMGGHKDGLIIFGKTFDDIYKIFNGLIAK